jgi:peptidyl-tRNA hydrolase
MGILKDIAIGGLAYGASELSKSHPVRDYVNEKFGKDQNKTIEDVVKEFAASQNIYTNNNEFAHKLHMLARYFEGYDYEDLYER